MKIFISTILALVITIFFPICTLFALENSECFECHGEKDFVIEDTQGKPKSLYVDQEEYKKSAHGKHLCTSCHEDITELPHKEGLKSVSCQKCHRIESQIYLESDHGKAVREGITDAASCKTCHGQHHNILSFRDPASPVNRLNIPGTCAGCHDDDVKMQPYRLSEQHPYQSYLTSIHGDAFIKRKLSNAAVCTDCHGSHDLHSAVNPVSKIYRLNIVDTCGKCHENVKNTYLQSIHGTAMKAGIKDVPVCTDCHGEHTIRSHNDPLSSTFTDKISQTTCPRCHSSERIVSKYGISVGMVQTYKNSYHGLAMQAGNLMAANCASCHGFHDILPSNDPRSSVNKANLAKTCSKCHPGVKERFLSGNVHVNPSTPKDVILYYARNFYLVLITLVLGGMVIHNGIDYGFQLLQDWKKTKIIATESRWTTNELVQHYILAFCFIVLAYTGFAHRYPESWWVFPFLSGQNSTWRGLIHREAAFVLIGLCIYHVFFISLTKRGRYQLREILPGFKDLKDFFHQQMYNLGLRKEKPQYGRFTYAQKAEYWALIWGSIVMILSGLSLVFETFTLKNFPLWMPSLATTVHFYEAVLATGAIIVWHFYIVIFSPHHYPMDWSWISGKVPPEIKDEADKPDKV
ncbi:MAG: hypothetical protein A2161_19935 [Candidatus Schekmanbacteria bacterium RBG_13_48_7]|uniref:Cytochrome b561 bacterial/Ni-hydrogenase domain-containing protein n=1 Tax=Candidatus Schekmanbacteria bacterium RBG_13_48_7 TaxID=1817878 RepID=A0A1F7S309_9BACT|nr:MAG: hypothetical protein A2161_19935 [Candidatus Schekmanbacteria bacterium RBG_13_48_7]